MGKIAPKFSLQKIHWNPWNYCVAVQSWAALCLQWQRYLSSYCCIHPVLGWNWKLPGGKGRLSLSSRERALCRWWVYSPLHQIFSRFRGDGFCVGQHSVLLHRGWNWWRRLQLIPPHCAPPPDPSGTFCNTSAKSTLIPPTLSWPWI